MRFFTSRVQPGAAIGAQRDFAENINRIFDILENIEGVGAVRIEKVGRDWRISVKTEPGGGDGTTLPDGDATNCALKWDGSPAAWGKSLPVHATNDALTPELAEGDRVVTGVKTGPTGSLLQLETRPLPAMGGGLSSDDLTQITVVTAAQYDSTDHKLQIKTRTAYVYSPGTESDWTDVVTFTQFND